MNFDSFSHGQVKSKIWLAENIENHIGQNTVILGSWYNVMGLILKTRGYQGNITGIDSNPDVKDIANKICSLWYIEGSVNNITMDATNIELNYDTVINCSSEHMSTDWYNNVQQGALVCIQSSNITDANDPWFIVTPSPNIDSFRQKYNLSTTLFLDTLRIQYGDWGYDRYMLIGYK